MPTAKDTIGPDAFVTGVCAVALALVIVVLSVVLFLNSRGARAERMACMETCMTRDKDPIACSFACEVRELPPGVTASGTVMSAVELEEINEKRAAAVLRAINMGPTATLTHGEESWSLTIPWFMALLLTGLFYAFRPFPR